MVLFNLYGLTRLVPLTSTYLQVYLNDAQPVLVVPLVSYNQCHIFATGQQCRQRSNCRQIERLLLLLSLASSALHLIVFCIQRDASFYLAIFSRDSCIAASKSSRVLLLMSGAGLWSSASS